MEPLAYETITPLRKSPRISNGRLTIVLSLAITLFLIVLLVSRRSFGQMEFAPIAPESNRDKLAYVSNDNQLMLYDPHNRTEMTLLEHVGLFVMGQDGRVAFTRAVENDDGLYVFDPSQPASDPIMISLDAGAYPLGWSPDGRYLAFASSGDSDAWSYQGHYLTLSGVASLYVWDGETIINVMPDNKLDTAIGFSIDWSNDGRLAFRIVYGWSDDDTPAEIYLWNGSTTSNVSQNPDGHDEGAMWSPDGKLMFSSRRNEGYGIYVWDGVSLKDGSPDRSTFIRIPPDLKPIYPTWIKEGLIGFIVASTEAASAKELIVWDLDTQTAIERRPISNQNGGSWLTEGGQVILSSRLASGIPSVYLDIENTNGEILFSDHVGEYSWSPSGYLAYCGIEDRLSRVLSIWDGESTWVVARVSYRPIQWQNGQDTFSCNNG